MPRPPIPDELAHQISHGSLADPFAVLGPHKHGRATWVTACDHGATSMAAVTGVRTEVKHPMAQVAPGVFCGKIPGGKKYVLEGANAHGTWRFEDAYRFGPVLGEVDEYLLGEGTHGRLWDALGAHVMTHEGTDGTHFAVWAPAAQRVNLLGDFNQWSAARHPMRKRGATGVWEVFIPGAGEGAAYKYLITDAQGNALPLKADPVGFGAEHPPATASIVRDIRHYDWQDADWMTRRQAAQSRDKPISIYEVHLASWKRRDHGRPISYLEAADELVTYARDMGFTHIELMPISEFPFDGSWGYQPVGLYAPTIRFGPPNEFRALVGAIHAAGLGLILDWVPGHFPTDAHGLGRFDGTALYEHADPKEGFHNDWNTLIYNFGRREVANFMVSNAKYWLAEYHVDGLRVDAVASSLYRDYSREPGQWVPNKDGGRENYEAIAMFQKMNTAAYGENPGIITIAEESTSFPKVSAPVDQGGLGFGYKWNMGWMNDTLEYIQKQPVYRSYDHHKMTFGLHYAFSENFVLPISHDEVVHGKGSMLEKMPGDRWEQFANLRAYYAFMWGHPGKKLLFMGQELAQGHEWNHDASVDWDALHDPAHKGIQRLVRDLNTTYRAHPSLHGMDCEEAGFDWIIGDDTANSVFVWQRNAPGDTPIIIACNFTPVERSGYRIGLPSVGHWSEILNTDAEIYGGGNRGNMGGVDAKPTPAHGQPASATLTLPPLSAIFLKAP